MVNIALGDSMGHAKDFYLNEMDRLNGWFPPVWGGCMGWEVIKLVKDPVCGMQVDEKKAMGTSACKGKTYFFCSVSCKDKFEKKPENYIKQ